MAAASLARTEMLAERGRELAELQGLVAASPLLTLCGPAGIGKTRLLQALAGLAAGDFPDGVFRAGLGDLREPDLAASCVARVLRVSPEPGIPAAETIAAALAGRRVLLALDGVEAAPGECASLCGRLLRRNPGLRIVAAGQAPLGLSGEVAWLVPPLTRPAPGEADPEQARRAGAVALFTDRAAAADPGFRLDSASCAAVTRICELAGGVPLSIELAAARLRGATAEETCASLAAVRQGAGPAPARHPEGVTVQEVIWWSHGLLSRPEQILLRRLSVLHSFTVEMAEQVCSGSRLPAAEVAGLLDGLAQSALIGPEAREGGQGRRYRMPGAVRGFAAQRLAEAGETGIAGRRLRDYAAHRAGYVVSIARAAVPVTWPVLRDMFADCDVDSTNIRAGLAWCLDHGDIETGLRACAELRIFWEGIGALPEAARWLDAFLDAESSCVPAGVHAAALAARAHVAFALGDLAGARERGSAAIPLCQAAAVPHFTGIAHLVLARVALAERRPGDALAHAGDCLRIARESGDWWCEAFGCSHATRVLTAVGRLDEAEDCGQSGLALAERVGLHWAAAVTRAALGDVAAARDDLPAARERYLAALPFMREAMPGPEVARCLARLAGVALRQDQPGEARAHLAESLELSLASGSRRAIARALHGFADLAACEGFPDREVTLAAAASAQRAAAGLPPLPPSRTRLYGHAAAALEPAEIARLRAVGQQLTSREAARIALSPPVG
jgi:predicted ATPase